MNPLEKLDAFIVEMLAHDLSEAEIAEVLLFEDFDLNNVELLETVKRIRRRVSGINVTMRKTGRPNPLKSQKAKRAARAHKASRQQAMRRFQRSPKAKQMRRVMSRMRKTKPRRVKMARPKRPSVRRRPVRRPVRRHGPPRVKKYRPPRRRR